MKLSKYLGDKPFWQVTLWLAIPISLQNVLTCSFQLVDTLMVSQLGDVALAAVGMAGQWALLANMLCFGVCSGMSVFVSQYWGIRDRKGIRRVLGIALLTGLLFSAIFTGLALALPQWVIGLFNSDPQVVAVGSGYLRIACLSYPAVMLTNIMATVLRNTERVKSPLFVSLITTVANAVVNYLLIFGSAALGIAPMGAKGAAVATCISSWLGPVLLLAISLAQKNLLTGPVRELTAFGLQNLSKFFHRAAPAIFNEFAWGLGIMILNMVYSNIGHEQYAGWTIFNTVHNLGFSFYVGLGNACVIMVGKSVGQGKIKRAVEDSLRFSVLVPLFALVVGLVTIALRYPLVELFSMGDNLSHVTLYTALAVIIFCSLEIPLRNIPYIQVVGVFRSGGDTMTGMLYDLGSLWAISIPLTLIAATVWKLPFLAVVIISYLAEDIPKSIGCLLHYRSLRWLKPVTDEGKQGLALFKNSQ